MVNKFCKPLAVVSSRNQHTVIVSKAALTSSNFQLKKHTSGAGFVSTADNKNRLRFHLQLLQPIFCPIKANEEQGDEEGEDKKKKKKEKKK